MAKGKGVRWFFDLADKVTGPAKRAGASIDELARKAKSLLDIKSKLAGAWNLGKVKGGGGRRGALGAFFGGAARGAGQGLGGLMKGAGEGLGGLAGGGTGLLQLDALMSVLGRVADAAKSVGAMALSMGEFALKTASAKTSLRGAFEIMLRSKEAAKGVVSQITDFAAKTPFEAADVSKTIKKLVGANIDPGDAFRIFKGFGDVSAFNDFDTGVLERMTSALTQMRGLKVFNWENLKEIIENSGGAVSLEGFAKAFDPKKTTKQVQDMLSKTKIPFDKGLDALLASIEERFGGKLGSLMNKMADEIPGLVSTLKDNLGAGLIPEVDESQGFSAVRDMLRSMVKASDRAGPFLRDSFGALFDTVFGTVGGLGGEGGQKVFESLFASVGRGVRAVAFAFEMAKPYMQAFAYGIVVGLIAVRDALKPVFAGMMKAFGSQGGANFAERFGEMLVMAGRAVGALVGGFFVLWAAVAGFGLFLTTTFFASLDAVWSFFATDLPSAFSGLWETLKGVTALFAQVGINLVEGLWNGITGAWGWMLSKFHDLVALLPAGVKRILKIESPSKVFAELGAFTAQGFQVGLEAGQPRVRDALAQTIAPSVPARALGGAGGGAGATISVSVGDIVVNAPAGASPADVARLVREQLTVQLALELERLAAPSGYAPAGA